MAVKNRVAQALEAKQMTRYRFWQETGLARITAYKLVNDPTYVPKGEIWDKVCQVFNCQPGDLMFWMPDDSKDSVEH